VPQVAAIERASSRGKNGETVFSAALSDWRAGPPRTTSYRRQMAPGAGVGEQRVRHHEIQRARKLLFRTREILRRNSTMPRLKMGLTTRQILRRGKRRATAML